jgi:hypothetical protein
MDDPRYLKEILIPSGGYIGTTPRDCNEAAAVYGVAA